MRELNPIEQSFAYISNFYPFTAICVLKVTHGPEVEILQSSVISMQKLHPLLNACIKNRKDKFWFEMNKEFRPVLLNVVVRRDENHWRELVKHDLNNGFSTGSYPLMKVTYLVSQNVSEYAEIILSFHHSIVDAETVILMADQLLSFASQNSTGGKKMTGLSPCPVAPGLIRLLPPSYRGIRFIYRLIPFVFRQMREEIYYKRVNRGIAEAEVTTSSENDITGLSFDKDETDAIIKWSRKNRITINSIISASMLITTNKLNYQNRKKLMRILQFGNLRPYLQPPLDPCEGGCFVAMYRNTIPVQPDYDLVKIAGSIDQQGLLTARRGDKFLFALISKFLVKKTIKAHNARLGSAALSYAGPVRINKQYGLIQVTGINGFITNNCLGAELTGFAKIFSGELSVDLNFLVTETSKEKASYMVNEIKQLILTLIHNI